MTYFHGDHSDIRRGQTEDYFLDTFCCDWVKTLLTTMEETNHLTYFGDHIYASKDRTGLFLNSVRKY